MAEPTLTEVFTAVEVVRANVAGIQSDVTEIKDHAISVNGALAKVKGEQFRMDGMMVALRWFIGVGIAATGVAVAVGGVAAGFIARGG